MLLSKRLNTEVTFSMLTFNPQMMRAIIMDHYQNPRNKRTPIDVDKYSKIHMDSASCVDDIWVYLLLKDDRVEDVAWDGVACTISTASTSIMSELVQGKSAHDALYIIDQYLKMIHEESFDDSVLDEAIVFMNTARQAARIKCATIGWTGLQDLILEEEKEHHHG